MPAPETALAVVRHGVCGQGDDADVPPRARLAAAELGGHCQTVQAGQLDVHEDDVVDAPCEDRERLAAVTHGIDLATQPPDHQGSDLAIDLVVLDKQHAERAGQGGVGRLGPLGSQAESVWGATAASGSSNQNVLPWPGVLSSPIRPCISRPDCGRCSARARSLLAPGRNCASSWVKLSKTMRLLIVRDADARVSDGQPDGRAFSRRREKAGLEHDLAGVGELDGVCGEVREHLTDADRIADEPRGDLGVDVASHLQPLLPDPWREQPHDLRR